MKKFWIVVCILGLLGQACAFAPGWNAGNGPTSGQNHEVDLPAIIPGTTPAEPLNAAGLPTPAVTTAGAGQAEDTNHAAAWAEQQLGAMTVAEKIGQMLVIGLPEDETEFSACALIEQLTPGGVFYHPGNVDNPLQLKRMSTAIQGCAQTTRNPPLFLALDHEGQYVNRYDEDATMFPAALAQGATHDPQVAYRVARAAGQELAFSGVNLILGPVADVLVNLDNRVVSQRTFGGDAQRAGEFVAQAVKGYLEAGLIPAIKHFPGHGGVAGDSHRLLPVDGADRRQLEEMYLPPFRSGIAAGAPVVMLSHVAFPQIAGVEQPASLSEAIVRLLREDLGFKGIILTDDMDMKAVSGGPPGVAEVSLQAVLVGADMLLVATPEQAQATHARLLEATQDGLLSQERIDAAVATILSVKEAWGLDSYPFGEAPEPDWQANASLAFEVGRQAVTLFKDEPGLLPLPAGTRRVLVLGPNSEWEFYPVLKAALAEREIEADFVYYTLTDAGPVPERELLESLPAQAAEVDAILFFTWQAYLNQVLFEDDWPTTMVENLMQSNPALIAVALKSPTDLLAIPQVPAYLALYGTTQGSLQGLLDVLLDGWEPAGQNPLPNLQP